MVYIEGCILQITICCSFISGKCDLGMISLLFSVDWMNDYKMSLLLVYYFSLWWWVNFVVGKIRCIIDNISTDSFFYALHGDLETSNRQRFYDILLLVISRCFALRNVQHILYYVLACLVLLQCKLFLLHIRHTLLLLTWASCNCVR